MTDTKIRSALLGCLNDNTHLHEYGEATLVDLPYSRLDGDSVRLLVEPVGEGYRISDRGDGADLASESGLNITSGNAATYLRGIQRSISADKIGGSDSELSILVAAEQLGCALHQVAIASIRVEGLSVLSQERSPRKFSTTVTERLSNLFSSSGFVRKQQPMPLTRSRTRKVTATVERDRRTVYVQAVSQANIDVSFAKCFSTFAIAEVPHDSLISVLQGGANDWSGGYSEDLADVSQVVFERDPERTLRAAVNAGLEPSLV